MDVAEADESTGARRRGSFLAGPESVTAWLVDLAGPVPKSGGATRWGRCPGNDLPDGATGRFCSPPGDRDTARCSRGRCWYIYSDGQWPGGNTSQGEVGLCRWRACVPSCQWGNSGISHLVLRDNSLARHIGPGTAGVAASRDTGGLLATSACTRESVLGEKHPGVSGGWSREAVRVPLARGREARAERKPGRGESTHRRSAVRGSDHLGNGPWWFSQ